MQCELRQSHTEASTCDWEGTLAILPKRKFASIRVYPEFDCGKVPRRDSRSLSDRSAVEKSVKRALTVPQGLGGGSHARAAASAEISLNADRGERQIT
jgi:hypothetical protein